MTPTAEFAAGDRVAVHADWEPLTGTVIEVQTEPIVLYAVRLDGRTHIGWYRPQRLTALPEGEVGND